jgi:hypothetical protein
MVDRNAMPAVASADLPVHLPQHHKRKTRSNLAERTAFARTQLPEYYCGWTESGEGGLQKIESDEGCQQQPIGADEQGEREAREYHQSGKSQDRTVDIHESAPMLS